MKRKNRKTERLAKKEKRLEKCIAFLSMCGVHGEPDYFKERLYRVRYKMQKTK